MKLTSVAFQNNQSIPQQFTCEGRGSNPALQISDVPSSAKSLVLIMDDPDTAMGVFLHWVLFNIPATTTEIKENSIPQGCLQGKNGIGKTGYIGPCPPTGEHHYRFYLYALSSTLSLPEGATRQEVEDAMKQHVVDQTQLVGLYQKQGNK